MNYAMRMVAVVGWIWAAVFFTYLVLRLRGLRGRREARGFEVISGDEKQH